MSHEFRLADLGEGLDHAEIIEWRVEVGDRVRRDQPLVEVMTDKSNAELPAPVDGVVVSLGGAVGDLLEVGAVVAVIDDRPRVDQFSPSPTRPLPRAARRAPAPEPLAVPPPVPEARERPVAADRPLERSGRVPRPKAAPATRLLARELGVDLATVAGTGPGGRILRTDVERAGRLPSIPPFDAAGAEAAPAARAVPVEAPTPPEPPAPVSPPPESSPEAAAAAAPADPATSDVGFRSGEPGVADSGPAPEGDVEPLRGIRRAIATNMARSWAEVPHIHAFEHVDAEPLLALRQQLRASGRSAFGDLTPLPFFVAAVAAALRDHPRANATLDLAAATITTHPSVHVGIAVAAPQGLVVPVVRDASRRRFADLAVEVRRLVRGAREGTLEPRDHRGGTATVTNFGSLGGEHALPLIRPPESVIFGFGSIASRPFVVDDEVVARKTMHVVLGADHRLLDGDVTTSMLRQVCDALANPINLVLGD